jgi:hypothetical protein
MPCVRGLAFHAGLIGDIIAPSGSSEEGSGWPAARAVVHALVVLTEASSPPHAHELCRLDCTQCARGRKEVAVVAHSVPAYVLGACALEWEERGGAQCSMA